MRILMVLLVVFSVSLLGCGSVQRDYEGDINYKTGTEGVYMKFMDNLPPNVVYDGDIFNIGIEMWNKGTEDVSQGVFYLSGFDRSIIMNSRHSNMPNQRADVVQILDDSQGQPFSFVGEGQKRTQYNREGGYMQYLFTGSVVLPQNTARLSVPIRIDACYLYNTEASISICLDPQPWKTDYEKACRAGTFAGTGSQGAPLAVTSIEQESVKGGRSLRIKVTVSNSGGGTLLDPDYALVNCPTYFNPLDINKARLEEVSIGGQRVSTANCKPTLINFGNSGTGYFYCEDIPIMQQDNSYMTTLNIKLRYGYKTGIQKTVELRKI